MENNVPNRLHPNMTSTWTPLSTIDETHQWWHRVHYPTWLTKGRKTTLLTLPLSSNTTTNSTLTTRKCANNNDTRYTHEIPTKLKKPRAQCNFIKISNSGGLLALFQMVLKSFTFSIYKSRHWFPIIKMNTRQQNRSSHHYSQETYIYKSQQRNKPTNSNFNTILLYEQF